MISSTISPAKAGKFNLPALRTGFCCLHFLLLVLILGSTVAFAQGTWTKYPGNPLNIHGITGSWDQSVLVPWVIFNEDLNRYEMWYTAIGGPPDPGIGFAHSTDGKTWSKNILPVMPPSLTGWDSRFVGAPCILVENGVYKMWYTGWNSSTGYPHSIGYAESNDGGQTWTKRPDPVLTPGSGWESGAVGYPSVIRVPGGYWMFYTGEISNGIARTGRAFSTDGITWVRDTANNPVLPPGDVGAWDRNNYLARVMEMNDSLYMWYTAESNPGISGTAIGFAVSADTGKTWIKYPGNPVLTRGTTGTWDNGWMETGNVLFRDDTLRLYYDGGGIITNSMGRVGLATLPFQPVSLQPGTYSVGTGGYFPTLDSAFTKLSRDGIDGAVMLELIDNLYTAPTDSFGFKLNGPVPGASPDSRVTIKPAENHNVIIEGGGGATISFLQTEYVTLDGVSLIGPTTLTIRSLLETQYTWINTAVFFHPSAHNIVQNVIFDNENYLKGVGLAFMSFVSPIGTADDNLIQNNFIKKATIGIYVSGWSGIAKATNNVVRGNRIGSPQDSLITWGIQLEKNQKSLVENNIIENIRQQLALNLITHGINLVAGDSCIIRNNVVDGVWSSLVYGSTGILLSGDGTFGYGTNNLVYNNMVNDIQSISTDPNSRVAGIQLWYQQNPRIYYNSVYLSGIGGTNPGGSGALFIVSAGTVTGLEVKNNILVNTRNESPYTASVICDYASTTFISDYNDLYCEAGLTNCLVKIGTTNYPDLASWQVTGHDLNSISEMPNFVAPYLHIDTTIVTLIDNHATPIVGINTDFDGQTRHATTPDIGADEFVGPNVILSETNVSTRFALQQNYPNPFNPTTVISWQLAVGSLVKLSVYDLTGREVAMLVNEQQAAGHHSVGFNASDFASGVYIYRLTAGNYTAVKKMLLLK